MAEPNWEGGAGWGRVEKPRGEQTVNDGPDRGADGAASVSSAAGARSVYLLPVPGAVEPSMKLDSVPTLHGHQSVACHIDFAEAFFHGPEKGVLPLTLHSRLWEGRVSMFSAVGFFLHYPHSPASGVSHRPSSSTPSNLRVEVSSPRSLSLIKG